MAPELQTGLEEAPAAEGELSPRLKLLVNLATARMMAEAFPDGFYSGSPNFPADLYGAD